MTIIMDTKYNDIAVAMHALNHPLRVLIIDRLMNGEASVNGLIEYIKEAHGYARVQPTISAQLKILREADLVTFKRVSKQHMYTLDKRRHRVLEIMSETYENYNESMKP